MFLLPALSACGVVYVWPSDPVPIPSWPFGSAPQHHSPPDDAPPSTGKTAQECSFPAATPVPLIPATSRGVGTGGPAAAASWPNVLLPQQRIPPSLFAAQAWAAPTATESLVPEEGTATSIPAIVTGVAAEPGGPAVR